LDLVIAVYSWLHWADNKLQTGTAEAFRICIKSTDPENTQII